MSLGLLFKSFLRRLWLKSSLVVIVSLAFPQACQGAKDPLGSSGSAGLWICLVPAHSPVTLDSYCPPRWMWQDSTLPAGSAGSMPLHQGAAPFTVSQCLCPQPTCLNPAKRQISRMKSLLHTWPWSSIRDSRGLQNCFKSVRNLVWISVFQLRHSFRLLGQGGQERDWDVWQQTWGCSGSSAHTSCYSPF